MEISLCLPALLVLVLAAVAANPVEEPTTNKTYASEDARCADIIGKFVNGSFTGLKVQYDLQKLLEKHGGPPGRVNATRAEKEDAPVEEKDSDKRPLPEANKKYWLYKFGDTDLNTYVRVEHAVKRFSGTPKAFTEIRGQLIFTPNDFCGKARKAEYIMDDRGFTIDVRPGHCWVDEMTVGCANPESCTTDAEGTLTCVPGQSESYDRILSGYFAKYKK